MFLHTKKEFFWHHRVKLTPLGRRTSFLSKRHPNIFYQQTEPAEEIQVPQGTKPTKPFSSFSMRLWLSSPTQRHLGTLAKLEMRHSHNEQAGLGIIFLFTGSRLLGSQTLGQGKDTGLGSHHILLHQEKPEGWSGENSSALSGMQHQQGTVWFPQHLKKRKKQKRTQKLSRAERKHCTEKTKN